MGKYRIVISSQSARALAFLWQLHKSPASVLAPSLIRRAKRFPFPFRFPFRFPFPSAISSDMHVLSALRLYHNRDICTTYVSLPSPPQYKYECRYISI